MENLNRRKPVWVELGLQTIHEQTAKLIRRGYGLPVFEEAFCRLKEAGLTVITHVILGLPGETKDMMLETVDYLGNLPTDGIKLQLLHILEGTDLARMYKREPFHVMTLEEYGDLIGGMCGHSAPVRGDPQDQRRRTEEAAHSAKVEWKQASCAEHHRAKTS